jgi:hypothetical protein
MANDAPVVTATVTSAGGRGERGLESLASRGEVPLRDQHPLGVDQESIPGPDQAGVNHVGRGRGRGRDGHGQGAD